jgi:hypothetical protein
MLRYLFQHRSAAGVVQLCGKIYALGGHNGLSIFDSVEVRQVGTLCGVFVTFLGAELRIRIRMFRMFLGKNRCIIPNFIIPNGRFSYVHYSYIAIFLRFKITKVQNS